MADDYRLISRRSARHDLLSNFPRTRVDSPSPDAGLFPISPRMPELWTKILARLENEIPEQQVNTWLRPLQAMEDGGGLRLLAPNRFAVDWVQNHAASRIRVLLGEMRGASTPLQ